MQLVSQELVPHNSKECISLLCVWNQLRYVHEAHKQVRVGRGWWLCAGAVHSVAARGAGLDAPGAAAGMWQAQGASPGISSRDRPVTGERCVQRSVRSTVVRVSEVITVVWRASLRGGRVPTGGRGRPSHHLARLIKAE